VYIKYTAVVVSTISVGHRVLVLDEIRRRRGHAGY